jgi:nucleoside-diphosphate-sugar epimerase
MKKSIALFGATGTVGSALLKKLLDDGHSVKVLVREPNKITEVNANLIVIKGDVLDYADVEQCVEGTEAVYVCIGTWGNSPTQVYSMGTENIIDAMKKFGIKRIICLSSAGVFGKDGGFFGRVIVPLTLWRPFRDKRKQAEILKVSGLDWTLVRPTEIKPENGRGKPTVSYDRMVNASVSILTLLDFLINELQNRLNIGKMPIVGD